MEIYLLQHLNLERFVLVVIESVDILRNGRREDENKTREEKMTIKEEVMEELSIHFKGKDWEDNDLSSFAIDLTLKKARDEIDKFDRLLVGTMQELSLDLEKLKEKLKI